MQYMLLIYAEPANEPVYGNRAYSSGFRPWAATRSGVMAGSVIGSLRRSRCFGGVLGHAMGQGTRHGGKLGLPGKFFRADVEICAYPASLVCHPC